MLSDYTHSEYKIRLGSSIWYVLKVFRKINILYPLIHTYQCVAGVEKCHINENFAYVHLNATLVVFISARNIFWNFWDTKEKAVRIECYIDKSRIFCSIHNSQNNFLLSTIFYFAVQVFSEWNNFFWQLLFLKANLQSVLQKGLYVYSKGAFM